MGGKQVSLAGKVAAVINRRELIINRGADAGVQEGMKFKVMDHLLEITDPESREILGTLEREKVRVKVSEVHPKFSIAMTYETYQVSEPAVLPGMLSPQRVTRVRTLEMSNDIVQSPDDRVASVREGDLVVELEGIG